MDHPSSLLQIALDQRIFFELRPDGTGLERLITDPAYDDQAAFSPDGKQLVFVSTRGGRTARLWTMDLATRRVEALTSEKGGDFRPSWSSDGKWIAFSSSRDHDAPFAHGRWERLQLADIYIIRPRPLRAQESCRKRRLLREP